MPRAATKKIEDPLSALAKADPAARRKDCPVVRAIASLPEERGQALRHLVDESEHSALRIEKACREAGVNLGHSLISRHRRKECACPA